MKRCLVLFSWAVLFSVARPPTPVAAEIPKKYHETVDKALAWLVKQQHADGHWSAQGGSYPVAMTALAGMALMLADSDLRDGKHAKSIRTAADWLLAQSRADGLIGDPRHPEQAGRYMFGHGFALSFLAGVYGEEADKKRRDKLVAALNRAVKFSAAAQTARGGWYYSADAGGATEPAVTMPNLQGLRDARNAGIAVPKEVLTKAVDYVKKLTSPQGGIVYDTSADGKQPPQGAGRPALTAAALACVYPNPGDMRDDLAKKWLKFCQRSIPGGGGIRLGNDEYLHFYYSQVLHRLGDEGWAKLFPNDAKDAYLTWSKYRAALFDQLQKTQGADGSWSGPGFSVGPVYTTAMHLLILQRDRTPLPRR